jgi:hypothetical protein
MRSLRPDAFQRCRGAVEVGRADGDVEHVAAKRCLSSVGVPSAIATRDRSPPRPQELVGLLEVLRGEQHRRAFVDEVAQVGPQVEAVGRIEAGGRFVEQQPRRATSPAPRSMRRRMPPE